MIPKLNNDKEARIFKNVQGHFKGPAVEIVRTQREIHEHPKTGQSPVQDTNSGSPINESAVLTTRLLHSVNGDLLNIKYTEKICQNIQSRTATRRSKFEPRSSQISVQNFSQASTEKHYFRIPLSFCRKKTKITETNDR